MKISIIVPIYNKESYLDKSLTSISEQSYKDIEVLLIDDGSTDSSGKICKSFCEKDSRFKYIYKQNGGVSSARNAGLIEATGDFIGFVDPDDFINKEMYHTLINQADIDELDIVACGINIIDGDNVTKIVNSDNEYYNSCKALENLLRWSYDVSPYLWNKIFRKNVLEGIKFDEALSVGEDRLFIFESLLKIRRYKVINKCLYSYVRNADSLVGLSYNGKAAKSSINSDYKILSLCKEKYQSYVEMAQCSLGLNAYFQLCRIIKSSKSIKKERRYFKDIFVENKKSIRKYMDLYTYFKMVIVAYIPAIYSKRQTTRLG